MNLNDIITPQPLASDLSEAEQHELKKLEAVIKKGLKANYEAGKALAQIRDQRLYRDKYSTFEEYCRKVWNTSKTHVNRQIDAVRVADVLTPIGVKIENEAVARPLAGLKEEQISAAGKKAQELAGEKPITAKIMAKAAEEFRPRQISQTADGPKKPQALPTPAESGQLDIEPALSILAEVEEIAAETKLEPLMKRLEMLRTYLERLAGAARKEVGV